MDIFKKRVNYKPFEYPEVVNFTDAIDKSFWTVTELNFTADIQDFHSNLSLIEKEAVKRSLLGISQIEVGVKTFWGNLYSILPKPEFNGLGSTFAHNEWIHSQAYAKLNELLGYNDEYEKIIKLKVFQDKLNAIEENMSSKDIVSKILFFILIIENCSLFSQFAIILAFTRFKGLMKNVSNVIAWTSVDEELHASAGIYILNKLKEEGHEINIEFVYATIKEYLKLEENLLDWIFELGEFEFFSKKNLLDFMKGRLDDALVKLNIPKLFNVANEDLYPMKWFNEEIYSNAMDDFFAKRPTDYTKHDKSISPEDLF